MMWKSKCVWILLTRNRFVVKATGNVWPIDILVKLQQRPTCILASLSLATVSWASAASLSLETRWIFSIFWKPCEYSQVASFLSQELHPVLWARWVNEWSKMPQLTLQQQPQERPSDCPAPSSASPPCLCARRCTSSSTPRLSRAWSPACCDGSV